MAAIRITSLPFTPCPSLIERIRKAGKVNADLPKGEGIEIWHWTPKVPEPTMAVFRILFYPSEGFFIEAANRKYILATWKVLL